MNRKDKGFTLIELLVVVAIISLLSSIIFASLNSARAKAKKAAMLSEMEQFVSLLQLEYSNTGSYGNLSNPGGWVNAETGATYSCDTYFPVSGPSQFAANANAICKQIVIDSGMPEGTGAIFISDAAPGPTYVFNPNFYSVMVWDTDGYLYCMGSDGKSLGIPSSYSNIGCTNNP